MKRTQVWLAFVLVTLGGCASQWPVESFEAPEGNLAARDTYFIKGGQLGTPTTVEPGFEQRLLSDVRETLRAGLARKGYTEVADAAAARMIVSYQVSGTRKVMPVDDARVGAPSPTRVLSPSELQPPPLSSVPRDQVVRSGTVIVFVDDPSSGRLVWRGMINADTRVGSVEDGIRVVTEMTRTIVERLPARAGQPPR